MSSDYCRCGERKEPWRLLCRECRIKRDRSLRIERKKDEEIPVPSFKELMELVRRL